MILRVALIQKKLGGNGKPSIGDYMDNISKKAGFYLRVLEADRHYSYKVPGDLNDLMNTQIVSLTGYSLAKMGHVLQKESQVVEIVSYHTYDRLNRMECLLQDMLYDQEVSRSWSHDIKFALGLETA